MVLMRACHTDIRADELTAQGGCDDAAQTHPSPSGEKASRVLTRFCRPSSQEQNRLAVPARNYALRATDIVPSCRLRPFCTASAAASRTALPLPGHQSALLLARQ